LPRPYQKKQIYPSKTKPTESTHVPNTPHTHRINLSPGTPFKPKAIPSYASRITQTTLSSSGVCDHSLSRSLFLSLSLHYPLHHFLHHNTSSNTSLSPSHHFLHHITSSFTSLPPSQHFLLYITSSITSLPPLHQFLHHFLHHITSSITTLTPTHHFLHHITSFDFKSVASPLLHASPQLPLSLLSPPSRELNSFSVSFVGLQFLITHLSRVLSPTENYRQI
jgi:hypothetical protein